MHEVANMHRTPRPLMPLLLFAITNMLPPKNAAPTPFLAPVTLSPNATSSPAIKIGSDHGGSVGHTDAVGVRPKKLSKKVLAIQEADEREDGGDGRDDGQQRGGRPA